MKAIEEREREAIQQLVARYRALGYTVEQDPVVDTGLRADLVARRGDETVLIDTKLIGAQNTVDVRRLAEVAQLRGWKFVLAVVDSRDVEEVELKSSQEIVDKLREARLLGNTSTAFPLLAWSVFEAAARNALARNNERFKRVMHPRALVQQLAALGMLDSAEERELMSLADRRSRIAHGFWPANGSLEGAGDFERVLSIAERLMTDDEIGGSAHAG